VTDSLMDFYAVKGHHAPHGEAVETVSEMAKGYDGEWLRRGGVVWVSESRISSRWHRGDGVSEMGCG
jgi:hypothetical protein